MRDPAYLASVRKLPCCACGVVHPVMHAHHRTGAGLALKATDSETMPLCGTCHSAFHDSRGTFRDWDKEVKRAYQDIMIKWTQRRLGVGLHGD